MPTAAPLLQKYQYGDRVVWYRPGTTDEKVIREVLERRTYRRPSIGFDVEPGERWLDLGANIGTFAAYCLVRGATVDCYEPEPYCFNLLRKNLPELNGTNGSSFRAAVSASKDQYLSFFSSKLKGNYYRGTLVGGGSRTLTEPVQVNNVYAGHLTTPYSGVKMDIEGAEHAILDAKLIPVCEKLCLEYHTSRDKSMTNLTRRIAYLRSLFDVVAYNPELDHMMKLGGDRKSYHDRVIYCKGRKKKPGR